MLKNNIMENLNIEKFSPTKVELLTLADKYKALTIKGIDDKEGYMAVHKARIELKNARTNLKNNGKLARSEALAYQKAVIKLENELVAIVEPIEKDLEAKQDAIDKEIEKNKRKVLLPGRKEKLAEINVENSDDSLLTMDDSEFLSYFNQKKLEYLETKERKIKEDEEKKAFELAESETKRQAEADKVEEERQAKLKEENDKLELERQRIKAEADKVEAEKKRLADQVLEAEKEKQRQVELETAKKQAIKAEAKRIETERLVKEEKKRLEKENLEKQAKYQNFLKDNNYTPDDIIKTVGQKTMLYRKVAEIII